MIELKYGAEMASPRQDQAMQKFRENRFGQFIHWGLYSMQAGIWQGKDYEFAAEFLPKIAQIPEAQWARLAEQFSIEAFDAAEWASLAVEAGAKYITITAKHHEGFCLWPSEFTDFHVGNAAVGRDVLGELVRAYEHRGLDVYLYYSVLDWHHPDWRYRLESTEDEHAFGRYLDFALNQLCELAKRYPSVKGFWFDGTWDESVKANGAWTWRVERQLKELIPGLIVSSRLRADDFGARHRDSNGLLMGDYESGYERRLPDPWDRAVTEQDWEACMTIPQASWGHHAGVWAERTVKNSAELIDMLAHCVSLGGNFLLNFGPTGDGSLAPGERVLAREIGSWLSANGEAIFGKGLARNWAYPGWGYFSQGADPATVYAIVSKIPVSGRIRLNLPAGLALRSCTPLSAAGAGVVVQELEKSIVQLDLSGCRPETLVFALGVAAAASDRIWTEPNPDVVN